MKHFFSLREKRGAVLIIVYMAVFVLMVLVAAYLIRTTNEAKLSERARHSSEAFYIAEGALQQILFDLRKDMANSPGWFDGHIGLMPITPGDDWTPVPYTNTDMGNGTFQVELKKVSDAKPMDIWARVTGTSPKGSSRAITRRIQAYLKVLNLNPWNNVIFAGTGQGGGNAISGNVKIRGSVHILGTLLNSGNAAMDLNGGGNIGNNYKNLDPALDAKLPDAPIVNGEESLSAEVRIKNGRLDLSGSDTAGDPNDTSCSPCRKELLNGTYVTNGYGGNKGTANVYSDNGTSNGYDADDSVRFPGFSDPYKGYERYGDTDLDPSNDYVHASGGTLSPQSVFNKDTSFSFSTDGANCTVATNCIAWSNPGTGTLTLTIKGVVYVNGDIDFGNQNPSATVVNYQGKGTIVSLTGTIRVHNNLLSVGTFPTTDVMGFVAKNRVEIGAVSGESQLKVIGAFYGENEIVMGNQCQVAGTFNSNHFTINQTPSIYQVPSLINNLPPGLIADQSVFTIKIQSWEEVQ